MIIILIICLILYQARFKSIERILGGELKFNAHNAVKWIDISELDELNWVPADIVMLEKLNNYKGC